jgi:hypothetical protein
LTRLERDEHSSLLVLSFIGKKFLKDFLSSVFDWRTEIRGNKKSGHQSSPCKNGATTFARMALGKMTLRMVGLIVTLSITRKKLRHSIAMVMGVKHERDCFPISNERDGTVQSGTITDISRIVISFENLV